MIIIFLLNQPNCIMANFQSAIQNILKKEGGYSNHSKDRGQETYMGISRRWHPNWLGWGRIDQFKKSMNGKIPNSHIFKDPNLQKMVNDFYYQTYWMDIKAGQLRDQKLAEYMLDTTIMHGFSGKKMIQQAVN
jgi:lysozyme family protein